MKQITLVPMVVSATGVMLKTVQNLKLPNIKKASPTTLNGQQSLEDVTLFINLPSIKFILKFFIYLGKPL
jgi:hypothetical protein